MSANSEKTDKSKNERIPPVVLAVQLKDEWDFCEKLKECTKLNITLMSFWKTTKLRPATREDHESLIECLKELKIPHFSYPFQEDKLRRFVIHNLPGSVKPDDILLDLKQYIPEVRNVKQMIKNGENGEKIHLPVFILTTLRCVTLKRFDSIKKICSNKYRIESFKANFNTIQCFKCQLYGHKMKYCNVNIRCLRCGEWDHSIKECTNTEVKCGNCGEKHVASYKKCVGRKHFEMKRGKPYVCDNEEDVKLEIQFALSESGKLIFLH